jgi:hypothetical protein
MRTPVQSNETPAALSRREAIARVLAGGLAAAALPMAVGSTTAATPVIEPEFVPENDYPFFGYEPGVTNDDHLI